jgi:membrane associated rhomboid family serine protease
MPFIAFVATALILINIVLSYLGLTKDSFFERYLLRVDNVLIHKEYIRVISSGFLHVSWMHLIFNMITLYLFSEMLEIYLGHWQFLVVYMAGLLGGSFLALFIHRHHGDYSAVGASGAISGIIFASIALMPGMTIGGLFLPIHIPGWLYGLLYMLYTIYGVRSKKGNIGHEAHLGGALVGMLAGLAFRPEAFIENYVTILIISVPALVFIYIIITRPHAMMVDNFFFKEHLKNTTVDDRYNLDKFEKQQEIDRLLEKIHRKGISSLSKAEKDKLDKYSGSR